MQKTINVVKHKNVNFSQAAKLFNIPRTTLKRRVNNINIDATEVPTFYNILNIQLVKYL